MNPLQVIKDAGASDLVKVTLRGPATSDEIKDVRDQFIEINSLPVYEVVDGGTEFKVQVFDRG